MPSCTATILSYMNKNIKIGIRLWHVHRIALLYLGNTVHGLKGSVSTRAHVRLKRWLPHMRMSKTVGMELAHAYV